jgi:c(7)-type cytochrome triheme protein
MYKKSVLVVMVLAVLGLAALAGAVPAEKTLTFEDNPKGMVTFDGAMHADAGKLCGDCHKEGVFPTMKKDAVKIMMSEINMGRQCGNCHNGSVTFSSVENCDRCHKK